MASAYVQKRAPMVLATTLLAQAAAATERLTDAKRLQFKLRYDLRLRDGVGLGRAANPSTPEPEQRPPRLPALLRTRTNPAGCKP
jgi:hypothetical protein